MFSDRFKLIFCLLIVTSCRNQPVRPFNRIAVVPLENLSTDRSYDWIGAVAPYVIAAQTIGAERILAVRTESDRDLGPARVTQVVRGYYIVDNGRLHIHAQLQDLLSNRVVQTFDPNGGVPASPLNSFGEIASSLAGKARPLPATDSAAWRVYGESLLATNLDRKLELAQAAFRKDPKLTDASLTAAQILLAKGQAAEARSLVKESIGQQTAEWERAQAEAFLAGIDGNADGLLEAVGKAVRNSPRDTNLIRQLGEATLNKHRYPEAAAWLRRAIELEPEQDVLWNARAYAEAYSGDFKAALQSLAEYRKRAPLNPNTLDSTGEIHWMAGQFAEAEKSFLEAQQRDPSFLGGQEFSKAAFARFLAGDSQGADSLHAKYIETRRALNDPSVEVRHAHWFMLTRRQDKALEQLIRLAQASGDAGSRASVLMAVLYLQDGKHAEAKAATQAAAKKAASAASLNIAGTIAFLAQAPASADEWRTRAGTMFAADAPPQLKRSLLGYAFLLGQHKEAVAMLQQVYDATPPAAGDEARILLGLAKLRAGDKKGAADLLRNHPMPPILGDSVTASLYFPGYLEWRKKALE